MRPRRVSCVCVMRHGLIFGVGSRGVNFKSFLAKFLG